MEFLSVIAATVASFALGSAWYMTLAKPWVEASGVKVDEDGQPVGGSAKPFIIGFICQIFVAGMMRHIFAQAGIDTPGKGLLSGFGIGIFMIAPWILLNNGYAGRPLKLSVIDGGYAALGCAAMGLVLGLF